MDTPEQESTSQPSDDGSTLQSRLANLLGSEIEAPESEPQGQPEPEVEAQAEPSEPQPTEEAAPAQDTPAEPETEEVEDESGNKHHVPKALKGRFMADKDYRQKTMALAEERKALEAVKQATQAAYQASTALSDIVTGIKTTESELQRLAQVDLQALEQTDLLEAMNKRQRIQELLWQRQSFIGQFESAHQQIARAQETEYAAMVAKNEPLVRERIKDWGPEKAQTLKRALTETYGFVEQELMGSPVLADARVMEIINDAAAYRALKASQPQTQNKVASVPPVAKPGNKVPPAFTQQAQLNKALAQVRRDGGETESLVAALKAMRRS